MEANRKRRTKTRFWTALVLRGMAVCGAVLCGASALFQPAAAQEAAQEKKAQETSGPALLNQAFELSKTAAKVDDFNRIIDLCGKALEAGVKDDGKKYAQDLMSWTLNRRGQDLLDAGQAQEAMADFNKSLELDPKRWRAYHNRGFVFAGFGEFDKALADFSKTIELSPRYDKAYFNRAEVYFLLQQFPQAVADYTETLKLTPTDSETYNRRGYAHYKMHDRAKAAGDFNRALQLDPNNVSALINRGDLFADAGQLEQAALDYRKAIGLDPNSHRAYVSASWMMSTSPDARYRNAALALQSAKKALELVGSDDNPFQFRYLEVMAAAHANAGEFDQALAVQAKALQLSPPDDQERLNIELKLYQAGQPYRDSIRTAPKTPEEVPAPNTASPTPTPENTPPPGVPQLGNAP